MTTAHVAIIGAGIAGLAAARVLRDCGLGVTVYEKSRGLGGRMATRRADGLTFDHGAQYFSARRANFASEVDRWQKSGVVATWFDDGMVGTPDMTAPAHALGQGITVVRGCTITGLARSGDRWSLTAHEGPVDQPATGFDAALLAIPAPQAEVLSHSAGYTIPILATAAYAPCWALMAAFEAPFEGVLDRWQPQDAVIAWLALNSAKPARAPTPACYVVHATPHWSRANLELAPEEARVELLAALARLARVALRPRLAIAHRWRYALVEKAADIPCYWDANAGLGACGDWCLGPRVELAFDSGQALGYAVAQALT